MNIIINTLSEILINGVIIIQIIDVPICSTNLHVDEPIDKHVDKYIDNHNDKHIDTQIDKHIYKHMQKHVLINLCIIRLMHR